MIRFLLMLLFFNQKCILIFFVFRFWINAGEAHEDERVESLSLKFMAQFASHVSVEAGIENMFSGSGHNDPRKTNTYGDTAI